MNDIYSVVSRSYISSQGHLRLHYPPNTIHLQWFVVSIEEHIALSPKRLSTCSIKTNSNVSLTSIPCQSQASDAQLARLLLHSHLLLPHPTTSMRTWGHGGWSVLGYHI